MPTSDPAQPATTSADQARAYVESLFSALGSREPVEVLREMPAALSRAMGGLDIEQLSAPERAGKWSVRQVVQHLADSEMVVGFRYRMILAQERPELPGYDQDLWAERLQYQESDPETALGDFTTVRRANLRLLERAAPADLERVMHHREMGDTSLEKLIRMVAGHDLVHLRQIARIRTAIGAPLVASDR